jgi:putative nucleotidyltransferase with HDIG domain
LTAAGVKGINVGKIHASAMQSSDELLKQAQAAIDYLGLYNDSLENVTSTIDHVLNNEDADLLNLRFGMANVMENLVARSQELLKLTTVKRYDMTTFVHILNVSIIAMYFASKLGFTKENVLDIGTAALFHDIGKLYISRRIIRKTDKLTEEEFDAIRSHTILGAEILLRHVNSLGTLPVVVCFEHHIKYDVSGYPKTKFPRKPHIASLLVTICDVYDALFQRRSYKASYAPTVVYDIMRKERGKAFEPALFDRFFSIFGVWPIGTLVELTDKRIGVVRDENADSIFLPKIEIVYPEDRREFVDLKARDGSLGIERHLDPATDGKPYVSLI